MHKSKGIQTVLHYTHSQASMRLEAMEEMMEDDDRSDLIHVIVWPVLGGLLIIVALAVLLYFVSGTCLRTVHVFICLMDTIVLSFVWKSKFSQFDLQYKHVTSIEQFFFHCEFQHWESLSKKKKKSLSVRFELHNVHTLTHAGWILPS